MLFNDNIKHNFLYFFNLIIIEGNLDNKFIFLLELYRLNNIF